MSYLNRKYFFVLTLIFTLLLSTISYAGNALPYDIDWHAYVNGSYNYLVRDHYFVSGIPNRDNDFAENGVRLQQGYFSLLRDKDGVGGYIQVIAGFDAFSLAPIGWDPNVFQLKNVGLAIPQAYLQYKMADFTLQAGEQASLSGWDDYVYTKDTTFSHAIIYTYAEAGSHMGIRAVQRLSDQVTLILGAFNGWNTIENPGQLGAVEGGLSFTGDDIWQVNFNALISPQYLTDFVSTGPQAIRRFWECYASYRLTKQLQIAGVYDYGEQSKALLSDGRIDQAKWDGLAIYLNYQINDDWFTALRGEFFEDTDGFRTGVRQNWREVTLSLDYQAIKNLHVIAETRHDFSNVDAFVNRSGLGLNTNQQSYALDLMYVFA